MLRTLLSYLALALRNLGRSPLRSGLTITGIAVSVAVFLTISAFYGGYRQSLDRTVERMGYEVLVTVKGYPYEAATLVMKGGNILMYVDGRVFDELRRDPDVGTIAATRSHITASYERAALVASRGNRRVETNIAARGRAGRGGGRRHVLLTESVSASRVRF